MSYPCTVYRSRRKSDTYLYVRADAGLARVPQPLLAQLGTLEVAMELQLDAGRRLARIDAAELMALIDERGYFLQLPRNEVDDIPRVQPAMRPC